MPKVQRWGYFFVLPFFLVAAVFQVFPIVDTLVTSFTNESLDQLDKVPQFIGWENYAAELGSVLLNKALINTLVIAGTTLALQMFLSLLLSALLTSPTLGIRRTKTWQVLFFLPSQISAAVLALYIVFFFDGRWGIINQVLHQGNRAAYFDFFSTGTASWAAIIGGTLFLSFGILTYFLTNSIKAIPKPVFEAAAIDGASGRQMFFHISLPYLRPILIFLTVVSGILDLCLFDLPFALFPSASLRSFAMIGVDGGIDQAGITLGTYAYQRSFIWDSDLGAGSAVVMMMTVLIVVLSAVYFRIQKKTQEEFSVVS